MSGAKNSPRKDGTRRRFYVCRAALYSDGTCKSPRIDADSIEAAIVEHLGDLFIDFDKWAEEQAAAAGHQWTQAEVELAARRKDLAKLQRQRDTARKRYVEKQTAAREDALEYLLQEVTAAQARVADAEARLAAVGEPPADAMLDAFNDLKRRLDDDPAPLNERLRRIFQEFRIGLVDDGAMIAVLPVLLPDAIETHAGPEGAVEGHRP